MDIAENRLGSSQDKPCGDGTLTRPALELMAMLRRREVSSEELIAESLLRIAIRNPRLQAFVSVLERSARRTAAEMDRQARRKAPAELPPFWGLPIGIKDLNLVRGAYARMGSRAWSFFISPIDDVTTRDLRRAGFVIVGKTTTSELALMPVVEPDIHPPTRNPWNEEHTAGGSSGGSAAAVAAGILPVAQASDGAGSIRIPASFCGLVGHKPSRGLLPNPHRLVDAFGLTTCGALTRTVEDAAAMLDVLVRRVPGAAGSFLSALTIPPGRLRIRFTTVAPLGTTAPEVAATARRVAEVLSALGHEITEVAPTFGTLEEFLPVYQRMMARAPVLRESRLQPITRFMREAGRRFKDADARRARDVLNARIRDFCGDADVVLTPTVPVLPPRVGAFAGPSPADSFARAAVLGAFTAAANLSGQPAISVPAGTYEGLPIGVQLIGRVGADALLLRLAKQFMETGIDSACRLS
jgi:amidase